MDAQRLLIWEVRERICFTRKRLFGTTSLLPFFAQRSGWVEGKGEVGDALFFSFFFFIFDMLYAYSVVCMSKSIE